MCSGYSSTIDLEAPPYDPDSYWGRVRNIFYKNNPLHLFASSDSLEEASCIYVKYICGEPLPNDITEEDLYRAKALYESAYNLETGKLVPWLARDPAQIPMNAVLAGGLMAYSNSTPGVVLWQWLNQTYNTLIGFATRDNEESLTDNQLFTSYALATGTAVGTGLTLKTLLKNSPTLIGRLAPFVAVAAAHCVSVPIIKAQQLKNGIAIYDEFNVKLGHSKRAAQAGIGDCILHKILIAFPPMVFTPIAVNYLEGRGTLCRYPWINFPAHVGIAGLCLLLFSPFTSALFGQTAIMSYSHLEPELQEILCKKFRNHPPKYVYYNTLI